MNKAKKVEDVREGFAIPLVLYDIKDSRYRHPAHPHKWHTKNLRCVQCKGSCDICSSKCCKFEEMISQINANVLPVAEKEKHMVTLNKMLDVVYVGVDPPTFLRCTTQTCRKLVCPECCGICPESVICGDIQCKDCKKDPWARCDWHEESGLVVRKTFSRATGWKTTLSSGDKFRQSLNSTMGGQTQGKDDLDLFTLDEALMNAKKNSARLLHQSHSSADTTDAGDSGSPATYGSLGGLLSRDRKYSTSNTSNWMKSSRSSKGNSR
ncbi:MAG: hypothetical protein M1824_001891 [Vezdaea acicularis]|nr:MAG: hypothetical protein M1824_001891 [Vezdaea acicularis]